MRSGYYVYIRINTLEKSMKPVIPQLSVSLLFFYNDGFGIKRPKVQSERNYFSWITPLTLDWYFIMLCVKQRSIKYHFLNLWYVIEPRSPGPLVNTLPTDQWAGEKY